MLTLKFGERLAYHTTRTLVMKNEPRLPCSLDKFHTPLTCRWDRIRFSQALSSICPSWAVGSCRCYLAVEFLLRQQPQLLFVDDVGTQLQFPVKPRGVVIPIYGLYRAEEGGAVLDLQAQRRRALRVLRGQGTLGHQPSLRGSG